MMKKYLCSFYKIFVVAVLLFGFGKASGQTATITIDLTSAGGTSNLGTGNYASGAERTWSQDGVDFGSKATTGAPSPNLGAIQAQANNGVLYNKTALPGKIISIVVTSWVGSTDRESTLTVNTTGPLVNNTAGNYTVTGGFLQGASTPGSWTISSGDYNFFAIKRGSSAAYWANVIITYATSVTPASIALSSANPGSTTGNLVQGSNNNVIYGFNLAATDAAATLNKVDFQTVGGYSSAEVSNYKLWYSTDATFSSGSDTTLKTLGASAAGAKSFSGFTQAIAKDATGYFFITTDVPCTADVSLPPTIKINAVTTAGLTFSSSSVVKSGTAYAGAPHTFTSSTPTNVSAAATSNCVSGSAKVSWTNPSNCFDQVFVFAKAGSFSTAVPTGDGTGYAANTTYGSGTGFDGGFLLYKGTLATVTALGLTNGTTYTYKIFTRKDTNWSNGIGTEVNCMPTIAYCNSSGTTSFDTGIRGVVFNTINNISQPISNAGYTDFTTISTTVQAGNPYNLSIYVNTAGSYTVHTRAWIDWNQNGTFEASEQYELGTANNNSYILTSASPFTITVPVGASLGNTRMRISTKYNSVSTSCESGFDGETEDYTINVIAACTPPTDPIGTISGTTSACTSTVLTYTGADSATAYWQTTATGISILEPATATKIVSTSGTYYVRIYDGTCWSTGLKSLAVVINDAPSITTQPANQIVYVGTQATFSVVATGTGLTYQWQLDKGTGFVNVTGADGTATTSSFQTVATTLAMTGYKYRVNITGTCGNVSSNGLAELKVSAVPLCTPIWEDNFDYGCTDNSNLPSITTNWVKYSGSSNDFKYNSLGLTYSGYASSGIGGAANLELGSGDDIRREFSPTGITSGPVYASFLINMDSGTTTTNDYFISLADASGGLQGRVYILKSGSQFKLGVSKLSASTADNSTSLLNFGTTYLVVIKYEMQNLVGNTDPFKLWVIPTGLPSSEAAAGAGISSTTSGTDATNLKYFVLRQMGSVQGFVDGIRVGTTWSDVVCAGAVAPAIDTYTWTGSGNSTSWTNACNWSPRGIPGATDNVIFNTAPTYKLNITDSRTVKDFTLNGTGTFNASATGILTINGNVSYGGTATATLDCDSQIFIKSTVSQPIPPLTYGNLDVLGGNRIFPNGGTIKICGGFNVVPDPSTSIYTVTGSTVEYISPASGWVMTPFTYNNLTFSGVGDFSFGYSDPAVDKSVTVLGNYSQSAGTVYLGETSSKTATMNIAGNMSISGGAFDVNRTSGGSSIVNLNGDLSVSTSAVLSSSTTTLANTNFNFSGTGDGTSAASTQTIDIKNPSTASYITFNVNNAAYAKLINQDFFFGTNSKFNVKNGAILDFGFNGNTPLNLIRVSGQTGQAFNAQSGSTLKITSPLGITLGSTPDYTGNVQIGSTAANRLFDAGATYYYIGKSATPQLTGSGLPVVTGNVIVEMEDATGQFAASNSKTLNSPGTLDIRKGIVTDDSTNGFIGSGNLIMNSADGRYITSRAGIVPDLTGTYTLEEGTIEFANTSSNALIRVTPKYFNVDISGFDIKPGGKDFVVNNILKVIKSTAVLTIPETISDSDTPYVLTAKNGLQVLAGKALFKNNANLMQETTANNIGNITMDRKTKMVKMDYTYWSSPVAGQRLTNTINPNLETSSGGFSPGTPNSRIFEYVEATDLFKATLDANFVAGKGYAIRGKNSFGTTTPTEDIFQFEGNPNNGNSISFNITKSLNSIIEGVSYEHGYNIIGNPYPSNINFAKFYDLNKTVINAKAWYWTNASPHLYMEGSTYNGNNYATVTLAGGVPPTYIPSSGNYKPTNIIKVAQGFIIQAKAVPTSVQQNFTINFNNDIRESGIGVFYNNVGKLTPENRYWLRMKSPSDIVNTILIGHFPNATDGYDANYDAELFTLGDDSLYSILDESKLQIQAKGDFQEDAQFILGTQFAQAGIYRFELEDPEGVFANDQSIYLYDKLKNTYTNLSQNSYQFETGKGKAEGRFEIVYKPGTTLVTDNRVKGLVQVYLSNDYFVVKSSDSKIEEIEIYDATGRLYQKVKGGTEEVKIDAAPLTNGLYVLKIKRKNETISKKIIK